MNCIFTTSQVFNITTSLLSKDSVKFGDFNNFSRYIMDNTRLDNYNKYILIYEAAKVFRKMAKEGTKDIHKNIDLDTASYVLEAPLTDGPIVFLEYMDSKFGTEYEGNISDLIKEIKIKSKDLKRGVETEVATLEYINKLFSIKEFYTDRNEYQKEALFIALHAELRLDDDGNEKALELFLGYAKHHGFTKSTYYNVNSIFKNLVVYEGQLLRYTVEQGYVNAISGVKVKVPADADIPIYRGVGDSKRAFLENIDGLTLLNDHQFNNGISYKDRDKSELVTKLLEQEGEISSMVNFRVSREDVNANKERLKAINAFAGVSPTVTNRTLETYERADHIKRLMKGKPIITVFAPSDDSHIDMFMVDAKNKLGETKVYSYDNYAIVYPDNRTVKLEFDNLTKEQEELVLSSFLVNIDGLRQPLTRRGLARIKDSYTKFKEFKGIVSKLLEDSGENSIIIPKDIQEKYLKVGGAGNKLDTVKKGVGAPLGDLTSQGHGVIKIEIKDDDGKIIEVKEYPALVRKDSGGNWVSMNNLDGKKLEDYVDLTTLNSGVFPRTFPTKIALLQVSEPTSPGGKYKLKGLPLALAPKKNSNDDAVFLEFIHNLNKILIEYSGENFTKPAKKDGKDVKFLPLTTSKIYENNTKHFFTKYTFPVNKNWAADIEVVRIFNDDGKFIDNLLIKIRPFSNHHVHSLLHQQFNNKLKDYYYGEHGRFAFDILIPINTNIVGGKRPPLEEIINYKKLLNKHSGKGEDKRLSNEYSLNDFRELAKSEDLANFATKIRETLKEAIMNSDFSNPTKASSRFDALEDTYGHITDSKNAVEDPSLNLLVDKDTKELKLIDTGTEAKENPSGDTLFSLVSSSVYKYNSIEVSLKDDTTPLSLENEGTTPEGPVDNAAETKKKSDTKKDSITDLDFDDATGDDAFSMASKTEDFVSYTDEQWQKEVDFIQSSLSGVVQKDLLDDFIQNILKLSKHNGEVLGLYKNRIIYMNKQISSAGTGYHEAFHHVFRLFLSPKMKAHYLKLASKKVSFTKENLKNFKEDRGLYHKTDSQLKDLMSEEFIADEFKKYMLTNQNTKVSFLKKLLKALRDVVNFILGRGKSLNSLFEDIHHGSYKNSKPLSSLTNDEMVFDVVTGRTVLTNDTNRPIVKTSIDVSIQRELQNRFVHEMVKFGGKDFDVRFQLTIEKLAKEYNILNIKERENLTDDEFIELKNKIGSKYSDFLFMMGIKGTSVRNLSHDERDFSEKDEVLSAAVSTFKGIVKKAASFTEVESDELSVFEEDESTSVLVDKFGQNFRNLDPSAGMSSQFRKFLSIIPVVNTIKVGNKEVEVTEMINGLGAFNIMMQFLADTPHDLLFSKLKTQVEQLKEEGSPQYKTLYAVYEHLKNNFNLAEEDGRFFPTSMTNRKFYNQFLTIFSVTSLPSYILLYNTGYDKQKVKMMDATVQEERNNALAAIKNAQIQFISSTKAEDVHKAYRELSLFISSEVLKTNELNTKNGTRLSSLANRLQKRLDAAGIKISLQTLKFSLMAMDVVGNKRTVVSSYEGIAKEDQYKYILTGSNAGILYTHDKYLFDSGAYLNKEFFESLNILIEGQVYNMFDVSASANADDSVNMSKSDIDTNVATVNSILRNAGSHIAKYDIDSISSVYKDADDNFIHKFVNYTYPTLVSQKLRAVAEPRTNTVSESVPVLLSANSRNEVNPILLEWFNDNPFLQHENKDFLRLFSVSTLSGAKQTLVGIQREGVTNADFDSSAISMAAFSMFLQRNLTTLKNGKILETFPRLYGQLGDSNTMYVVPAKYQMLFANEGYTENEDGKKIAVERIKESVKQQFNRIQREYHSRYEDKPRYEGYNIKQEHEGYDDMVSDKSLRAYKFTHLQDLFGEVLTTNGNPEIEALKNEGLNLSKQLRETIAFGHKNVKFENIDEIIGGITLQLEAHIEKYLDFRNDQFIEELKEEGVIEGDDKSTTITSKTLPTLKTINGVLDKSSAQGPQNLRDMLVDMNMNLFINSLFMNQVVDGDYSIGIDRNAQYVKRGKSGVGAGKSGRVGFTNVGFLSDFKIKVDPNDIEVPSVDVHGKENKINKKDIVYGADGQSYEILDNRLRMLDQHGRIPDSLEGAVKRLRKGIRVTREELKLMNKEKLSFTSYKSVMVDDIFFGKQSQHILFRHNVSVVAGNSKNERTANRELLNDLYEELFELQNAIEPDKNLIRAQYDRIHKLWVPIRMVSEMHHLLNSMELQNIGLSLDHTAAKKLKLIGAERNPQGFTDFSDRFLMAGDKKIKVQSVYELDNVNYLQQVETAGQHSHIKDPTQKQQLIDVDLKEEDIKEYINSFGKDKWNEKYPEYTLDKILKNKRLINTIKLYRDSIANIRKQAAITVDYLLHNMEELENGNLKKGSVNVDSIYTVIRKMLADQGADDNLINFFTTESQGVYNPNLSNLRKKYKTMLISYYSNHLFAQKVAGRKDFLVASSMYNVLYDVNNPSRIITRDTYLDNPEKYQGSNYATRKLGIRKTIGTDGIPIYEVEIVIPYRLFKEENHLERDMFLKQLSEMISTRIPTEDKRSMVSLKVVDYMEAEYDNTMVVPQLVHMLSGSDLDIDSLYSQMKEVFTNSYGVPSVYGDYTGIAKENLAKTKFGEYINYMSDLDFLTPFIESKMSEIILDPGKLGDSVTIEDVFKEIDLAHKIYVDDASLTFKDVIDEYLGDVSKLDSLNSELEQLSIELSNSKISTARAHQNLINLTSIAQEKATREGLNYKDVEMELELIFREEIHISKFTADRILERISRIRKERSQVLKSNSKINSMVKTIATIQTLIKFKYPHTVKKLESYTKKNGTPVIPVLRNQMLDAQRAIISDPITFEFLYKHERSTVKPFEDMLKKLDMSVEQEADKFNIFSLSGIKQANKLNTASLNSVSITAATSKVVTWGIKKGLKLNDENVIWKIKYGSGDIINHDTLRSKNNSGERIVKLFGQYLSMFVDAANDPIPSVLGLSDTNAAVSLGMTAVGVPLNMALIINFVPAISKVIKKTEAANKPVITLDELYSFKSLKSIGKNELSVMLKSKHLQSLLYEKDEDGKLQPVDYTLVFTDENIKPSTNISEEWTDNLGFSLLDENGNKVNEPLLLEYILLKNYIAQVQHGEVLMELNSIVSLNKKQKPDLDVIEKVQNSYEEFIGEYGEDNNIFSNLKDALLDDVQLKPLIGALYDINDVAEKTLLERKGLFKKLIRFTTNLFPDFKVRSKDSFKDRIAGQFLHKMVSNRYAKILESRLEASQKEQPGETKVQADSRDFERLNNMQKLAMFNTKYWTEPAQFKLSNPEILTINDMYVHLKTSFPDNEFVRAIIKDASKGLDLIKSLSRIARDTEEINELSDAFKNLSQSYDKTTRIIIRSLFSYLMVVDDLTFKDRTFIKYVDPAMFTDVSRLYEQLTEATEHATLYEQYAEAIYKFFNPDVIKPKIEDIQLGMRTFIDSQIRRIGRNYSNAMNYAHSKPYKLDTLLREFNKFEAGNKIEEGEYEALDLSPTIHGLITSMFPRTHESILRGNVKTDKNTKKKEYDHVTLNTNKINHREFFVPGKISETAIGVVLNLGSADFTAFVNSISDTTASFANTMLKTIGVKKRFVEENGESKTKFIFQPYIINSYGHLLELKFIQDEDSRKTLSEKLIEVIKDEEEKERLRLSSGEKYQKRTDAQIFESVLTGTIAIYEVVSKEGSSQISNMSFTDNSGSEIYDKFMESQVVRVVTMNPELREQLEQAVRPQDALDKPMKTKDLRAVNAVIYKMERSLATTGSIKVQPDGNVASIWVSNNVTIKIVKEINPNLKNHVRIVYSGIGDDVMSEPILVGTLEEKSKESALMDKIIKQQLRKEQREASALVKTSVNDFKPLSPTIKRNFKYKGVKYENTTIAEVYRNETTGQNLTDAEKQEIIDDIVIQAAVDNSKMLQDLSELVGLEISYYSEFATDTNKDLAIIPKSGLGSNMYGMALENAANSLLRYKGLSVKKADKSSVPAKIETPHPLVLNKAYAIYDVNGVHNGIFGIAVGSKIYKNVSEMVDEDSLNDFIQSTGYTSKKQMIEENEDNRIGKFLSGENVQVVVNEMIYVNANENIKEIAVINGLNKGVEFLAMSAFQTSGKNTGGTAPLNFIAETSTSSSKKDENKKRHTGYNTSEITVTQIKDYILSLPVEHPHSKLISVDKDSNDTILKTVAMSTGLNFAAAVYANVNDAELVINFNMKNNEDTANQIILKDINSTLKKPLYEYGVHFTSAAQLKAILLANNAKKVYFTGNRDSKLSEVDSAVISEINHYIFSNDRVFNVIEKSERDESKFPEYLDPCKI